MDDLFSSAAPRLPFELPKLEGDRAHWQPDLKGFSLSVPHGKIFYAERFFSQRLSDRTVEYFQENERFDWRHTNWRDVAPEALENVVFKNIAWKQDWINLYGKSHPLPRLTAWYGDSERDYTYSGIKSKPNQWNQGLLHIKHEVERCAGLDFNSVLLNWYRDGNDHLSWHSDDEKELGPNPVIASANFGTTRDFVLRPKNSHADRLVLPLKHGTLLLMSGSLQHFWQHSVPKRTKAQGSRFNLTFRRIGL